jgi:predicted MFS family arabinose efflux permease
MQSHQRRFAPPLTLILAAVAMIGWLNGAAVSPFLPEMADDLGASVSRIGQATSILFLLAAGVSLVIGPVADARGTRRLLVAGLVAVAFCALGTSIATNYWMLMTVRLTGAFAAGALGGLSMAVAATMFEGNERRRAIGWIAAGIAGGAVAGIPLLTAIGSLTHWRIAFVAIALSAVALILLLRAVVPDDARYQTINTRTMLDAYRPLLASGKMQLLYLTTGLRSIGWMGFLLYAGAFYEDQHGLKVHEVGWTYMIGGASFFAGTRLAGSRLDDRPLRPIAGATIAFTGLAVGAMLMLPVGLAGAVAMMTAAAFTLGISSVCISTLIANESPAGRGTTMALNTAVLELATAGGGILGGALLAMGGFKTLGFGLSALTLLSAITLYQESRSLRRARLAGTPGD